MESTFNMAATAEAFQILSSNLYSNPKLAIIRELSTNAYDSHRDAGKDDDPFILHLPTSNEQFFYIRDFGTGIPEDLIYNIYVNYFTSTKSDREDQTGYFGLGSKTPFSLVDKYFVTSYSEGKKITYKMEKKNGLPTVEKVKEEPIGNEPTGLEIRFDLKGLRDWEYNEWDEEARNFFKGTSFLPDINTLNEDPNFNWEAFAKDREFYSMDSIKIGNCGYNPEITVNVAGVNFNVNLNDLKARGDEIRSWFRSAGVEKINIMAGKSDVSLTPSREVLHYDDKTVEFICNGVKKVIGEYYDKINQNFDNYHFTDAIKLRANQSYDPELNEKIESKVKNLFFCKSLIVRRGGRGAHLDVSSPVSYNTGWRGTPDRYIFVDFNGIKSTVKQGVVDNFLSLSTFDDKGKLTSTSFANVIKSFDPDHDYVVVFPRDYKDADNLKACKEFLGDEVRCVKWADYCDAKKEATGRKLGFKTQQTMTFKCVGGKNEGTTYGYYRSGTPDLADDEVGVLIEEEKAGRASDYIRILRDLGLDYNVVVRPCKESVFKKYKDKGFQTLKDYVDTLVKANIDTIKTELENCRKKEAITKAAGYYYSEQMEELINDPEFDELEVDENFKLLRELYKKEVYDAQYHSSFTMCGVDEVPSYSIDFSAYPLYNMCKSNLDGYNIENFRLFFNYMKLCRKDPSFQTQKKIEEAVA